MEVPRTDDGGDEEDEADPSIESQTDSLKQDSLANGTNKGQAVANEVKFGNLTELGQQLTRTHTAKTHLG